MTAETGEAMHLCAVVKNQLDGIYLLGTNLTASALLFQLPSSPFQPAQSLQS